LYATCRTNSEVAALASKLTPIIPSALLALYCKRCQTCQRRHRGTLCLFRYSIPCLWAESQEGIQECLQNGHLHFSLLLHAALMPNSSSGCLLSQKMAVLRLCCLN
jgi:hypothetical protein